MGDRGASGSDPDEPPTKGSGKGTPLIRRGFGLPADLDYKLRMATSRRGMKEVVMVREALAKHLGHDLGSEPREAVSLPSALVDALSETAARRGISPDELATDLLVEALERSPEED